MGARVFQGHGSAVPEVGRVYAEGVHRLEGALEGKGTGVLGESHSRVGRPLRRSLRVRPAQCDDSPAEIDKLRVVAEWAILVFIGHL